MSFFREKSITSYNLPHLYSGCGVSIFHGQDMKFSPLFHDPGENILKIFINPLEKIFI